MRNNQKISIFCRVAKLEEENNVLQATWAEERSGLVNELIDTKEKLAKSAQAQTELDESHRDIMTAVPVAKRTAMVSFNQNNI